MAAQIAKVTYGIVRAVPHKVACFAAVLACLLIGALVHSVAHLVAIGAEAGGVTWKGRGDAAVTGQVACPPTLVADALVRAGAGCVPGFFAVEAQGFHAALRCNVPVTFPKKNKHQKMSIIISFCSKQTAQGTEMKQGT